MYHIRSIELASPNTSHGSLSGVVAWSVGRRRLGGLLGGCGGRDLLVHASEGFEDWATARGAGEGGLEGVASFGGTMELEEEVAEKLVAGSFDGGRAEFERQGMFSCSDALELRGSILGLAFGGSEKGAELVGGNEQGFVHLWRVHFLLFHPILGVLPTGIDARYGFARGGQVTATNGGDGVGVLKGEIGEGIVAGWQGCTDHRIIPKLGINEEMGAHLGVGSNQHHGGRHAGHHLSRHRSVSWTLRIGGGRCRLFGRLAAAFKHKA